MSHTGELSNDAREYLDNIRGDLPSRIAALERMKSAFDAAYKDACHAMLGWATEPNP